MCDVASNILFSAKYHSPRYQVPLAPLEEDKVKGKNLKKYVCLIDFTSCYKIDIKISESVRQYATQNCDNNHTWKRRLFHCLFFFTEKQLEEETKSNYLKKHYFHIFCILAYLPI